MNSDENLVRRAEIAEEQHNFEESLQLWSHIVSKAPLPIVFCRAGRMAEKLKRWTEAENNYSKALEMDPAFFPAMECLGGLFCQRDDGDEKENIRKSKEWFLRALRGGRTARLLTFLSNTVAVMGETENAKAYLREALVIDPNYEEACLNLAELEKEEQPEEAINLLRHAVEIDPRYFLAHQRLGLLLQHSGDLFSSEYHYRRCLELNPNDYWSYLLLANLLAVQNRSEEAEDNYRTALEMQPYNKDVIFFFANFLDDLARDNEANDIRMRLSENRVKPNKGTKSHT
jgi:tetratricopeptide (TPR) repeat protein